MIQAENGRHLHEDDFGFCPVCVDGTDKRFQLSRYVRTNEYRNKSDLNEQRSPRKKKQMKQQNEKKVKYGELSP